MTGFQSILNFTGQKMRFGNISHKCVVNIPLFSHRKTAQVMTSNWSQKHSTHDDE